MFQPVFGCYLHLKAKFAVFSLFSTFAPFFFISDTKRRKQLKKLCLSDSLKLVDTQKLVDSLREVPNFAFFGSFFAIILLILGFCSNILLYFVLNKYYFYMKAWRDKDAKRRKDVGKQPKTCVDQLSSALSIQNLVEIHNSL